MQTASQKILIKQKRAWEDVKTNLAIATKAVSDQIAELARLSSHEQQGCSFCDRRRTDADVEHWIEGSAGVAICNICVYEAHEMGEVSTLRGSRRMLPDLAPTPFMPPATRNYIERILADRDTGACVTFDELSTVHSSPRTECDVREARDAVCWGLLHGELPPGVRRPASTLLGQWMRLDRKSVISAAGRHEQRVAGA